jgi:hypothetical protein
LSTVAENHSAGLDRLGNHDGTVLQLRAELEQCERAQMDG